WRSVTTSCRSRSFVDLSATAPLAPLMRCGYLEQVERCAYRVVDADEDGDVGQTLCSKAVFGLPVERLVDSVSGGKLPCQLCGDLLVLAEVIWYRTAGQRLHGDLRDAGFAGCCGVGVQLILGLPDRAHRQDHHFAQPRAQRRVLPLAQ